MAITSCSHEIAPLQRRGAAKTFSELFHNTDTVVLGAPSDPEEFKTPKSLCIFFNLPVRVELFVNYSGIGYLGIFNKAH